MAFRCSAQRSDFNPRAPCGARRPQRGIASPPAGISIHAPHTGRDYDIQFGPRGAVVFQSTRPIRGATPTARKACIKPLSFQSTRPIRGATGHADCGRTHQAPISIHAPHTGRDERLAMLITGIGQFQSTRPIRGATSCRYASLMPTVFQSTRPIRGATLSSAPIAVTSVVFQSTRPIRGATKLVSSWEPTTTFQSTRPIRGATDTLGTYDDADSDFNPRAPYGARQII